MNNDMKCLIKCPICGEILQKYGEVDPDAGTSTILGANCRKCGIKDSDIKLWQELIRTRKALDKAKNGLKELKDIIACPPNVSYETGVSMYADGVLQEITALEQKDVK